MKLENIEHVNVTNTGPTDWSKGEQMNCEANVAKLENGELVVVYQAGVVNLSHDVGDICLLRSRDGGQSWDAEEKLTVFPSGRDHGHNLSGITQLSDGTIICNTAGYQFLSPGDPVHMRSFKDWSRWDTVLVRKSDDSGYTWGDTIRVNIAPMIQANCRDSIVEMPDGSLLLPLHANRYAWKGADGMGDRKRSIVLWSGDRGESWHN